MRNVSGVLSKGIVNTNYSDLPQEVIAEVKRRVLDVVGVILAGSKTDVGGKTQGFVKNMKSGKEATIIGLETKASSAYAALANAAMGFHLELDDVHRTSHMHPGITTIPSALSVGEALGSSGKDLIAAINAGYETEIRIGNAVSPSVFLDRVFLPCGLIGGFGATAVTGKLLGLDEQQMIGAIGNIATLAPVSIFESFKSGTMAKEMTMGWANFVGITSALMAENNIGGPDTAIEGSLAFARAAADEYDIQKATRSDTFYEGIKGAGMKPYACCRQHHSAIDAALDLRNKYSLKPPEIEKIVDRTFSVASRGNEARPKTIAAAKYSAPYILAVALTEGDVLREQFNSKKIADQDLLDLAQKVQVVLDPELEKLYDEKWPSIVEVTTKEGKTYSSRFDLPKGEPENPIGDEEIKKKFISLAMDAVSEKQAEKICEAVLNLDRLKDVSFLLRLLQKE